MTYVASQKMLGEANCKGERERKKDGRDGTWKGGRHEADVGELRHRS